jgi:hypothetical protein
MERRGRRTGLLAYAAFWSFFGALIFLSHLMWLDLPFFWDELGYYVPAALDLFREGRWICKPG